MTILDQFESYLDIQCHLAKQTVAAYKSDINHFLETSTATYPTESDIISFFSDLTQSEYTKNSISRKSSALKMYCHFLESEYQITSPNIKQLFESNLEINLPKLISKQTLNQCLDYQFEDTKQPYRNQCLIGLLYFAGCRVSEAVSLRINHVFSDHIIVSGKGEKERMVPLSFQMKHRMTSYLSKERQDKQCEWLFYNNRKNPLTRQTISLMILKMCRALKITERVTPHSFRHRFATHLLEKGMDIREVQLMLGHASINTTQIYTHLDKSKLKHVFNTYHPLS